LEDTSTLLGAVMVKFPLAGVRLAALMEKVVSPPGVPEVVAVRVVVPPGTWMVGKFTVSVDVSLEVLLSPPFDRSAQEAASA